MWMDECGHSRAQARFPVPRWSSARAWTWASDSPDEQQRCPHGGGTMPTRRSFLKLTGATTLAWYVASQTGWMERAMAQIPGGTLDPTRHQVRDADADPPGDAPGGDAHHAGRQTSRLLRDLHAPALPADPAGGPAGHDRVGLRRGHEVGRPAGGCCIHHAPSLTIESTWKRPVRIKWINDLKDAAATTGRTCCPWTRRCTGPTHPAAPAGRDSRPTFTCHARPLHRPGADRDPPARRGRGRRRKRRLRRGLVPARRRQHPRRLRHRGHLVRLLRRQGELEVRRRLGAGVRDLPVPQRPARVDPVVPRPRPGHDPPERVRRPGRVLPGPRRPRGRQGRPRPPHQHHRGAAQPGPQRKRHVPAQQDLLRDPDRGPGPLLQHRRLAVLPRHAARSSTASPATTSPRPTCRRSGTRSSSAT